MTNVKLTTKMKKRMQEYCLLDDSFMNLFFDGDKEVTQYFLRIILNIPDLKVTSVRAQKSLPNYGKRSGRIDVHAVDSKGNHYDIEMQRNTEDANPRRARFYSSLMDTKMLEPGQKIKVLKDSYVIFITEKDVRKKGKQIYTYETFDAENGEHFEDGRHIIYVNTSYNDVSTERGKLIHDIRCKNAKDMYHTTIANKVRYLKETKEGQDKMGSEYERILREGKRAGIKEGEELNKVQIAKNMISNGLSIEMVSKCSGLSIEKVMQLAEPKAV